MLKDEMRRLGFALAASALAVIASAEAQEAPPGLSLLRDDHARLSLLDGDYVRIGSAELDGPPERSFGGVIGAVLLSGGEVVVADGSERLVHWFDLTGRHVRSVGGEGEGPGEFRALSAILACSGELLVFDPPVGRITALSAADGRALRTSPVPPTLGWNRPLACPTDGRVLALLDRGRQFQPGERGRVSRAPAALVRLDLSAGTADTLRVLPGTDFYYALSVAGFSDLPLGGSALAAAGGGRLYGAQSDGNVIHVMELPAGAWTTFAHGLPRPRATREAWDRAVAEFVWRAPHERSRQRVRDVLREAAPPEHQAAFLAMKADAAGRVWLRLPGADGPAAWRIFDHQGLPIATIELPGNVEPLDIGERHLVALERGPLDVPMIRVYSLPGLLQPGGAGG